MRFPEERNKIWCTAITDGILRAFPSKINPPGRLGGKLGPQVDLPPIVAYSHESFSSGRSPNKTTKSKEI